MHPSDTRTIVGSSPTGPTVEPLQRFSRRSLPASRYRGREIDGPLAQRLRAAVLSTVRPRFESGRAYSRFGDVDAPGLYLLPRAVDLRAFLEKCRGAVNTERCLHPFLGVLSIAGRRRVLFELLDR